MSYRELDMDVTEEQAMFRDAVRKFGAETLRPASIKLDEMSPEEVIAPQSLLWDTLKKSYAMGLHKILIPEEYGGLGLSPLEISLVAEEMGFASAGLSIGLGLCSFPAFLASMVPSDSLIENLMIPYCEDTEAKIIGCWAITEPDHGSDTLAVGSAQFKDPRIAGRCRARREDGEWVINGQKSAWVSLGSIATHAMVYLNIDPSAGMAGGGICLVPLELPGVTRGKPLNKMGQRELNQGEIYFDDVRVPLEYMFADQESYEAITDITLATCNAYMAATFTGTARAAYEEALQYSRERIQGGKRLFEHQHVRYKLFHMFKTVEACRALSRAALNYNLCHTPPATEYSVAAKIFCTDAAFQVASDAVQIFGGNGVAKEYVIEKIFRDARTAMIEDGSNDSLAIFSSEKL